MNRPRLFLLLGSLLCAALPAHAQGLLLKAGNFNSIFVDPSVFPVGSNQGTLPATVNSNFRGMGPVSGSTGPIDDTPSPEPTGVPPVYPAARPHADRYPSTADNTLVLVRSTLGGMFASDVPLYFFGDVIAPPLVQADGITPAAANYWRAEPVKPGEFFQGVNTGAPLIPFGSVYVTASSSNSKEVTISLTPPPVGLVVGATLFGQPVTKIVGTTVTLADEATDPTTGLVDVIPATSFYYSPHALKVYASQAGRVTITWVTSLPDGSNNYSTRLETFTVSSTTRVPVRTIYWTEGGFDGPKVRITDSRITTVNPVYYDLVPKKVPEEVEIPGSQSPPGSGTLTTLAFTKTAGTGELSAYNVEGRILIEYLGEVRAGKDYFSIGTDVVELVRTPEAKNVSTHLGRKLEPHDGNVLLQASPVLALTQGAASYYGTSVRPDGTSEYFAERETSPTNDPDDGSPGSVDAYNKVVFYWLEEGAFSIRWPKFQNRYWLRWSPNLDEYAHYTVAATATRAEAIATGLTFSGGLLPEIKFQDDGAQTEAAIDPATQRLSVVLSGGRTRNRSLLKFSGGGKAWYVNLYTQAENRSRTLATSVPPGATTITVSSTVGLEAGMIVTGPGSAFVGRIASITDATHFELVEPSSLSVVGDLQFTVESDAAAPIKSTATVGTRLAPPAGHEIAGYISGGQGYYPAGYRNPFVVGVEAANLGAIIPVNALPSDNVLTVRWFRKVAAPGPEFQDLYVPGKIGRYTVSYPASSTPQIVIAEGIGTGNLPPPQAAGTIYTGNTAGIGFNPNEEHALMLGGRAYALRDDLNITTGSGYTSQPFVLVAYTDPTDLRPAIRAFKVVREVDQNNDRIKDPGDILFDYTATAGTLLVKPYPLPDLPLALVGTGANRKSKDIEIKGTDDPANTNPALKADDYKGFTFKDRKGFTWVHRGPHDGGSPTLTMKLYYLSQSGFFVPGIGEPVVGTVLPFLRAAGRTGTLSSGNAAGIENIDNGQSDEPLSIIYRPAWPTNAPELGVGETLALPKFGLPQVRGQKSAQVLYQQSIARDATNTLTKTSVVLHDPTREKTVALDAPGIGLNALPSAIKTTSYQGKTYFQRLPPHLQTRFYLDPMRGAKGTLVLLGTFHDEIAGEDYFDLNLLTAADELLLKDLVPTGGADEANWDNAIDALMTEVETFIPDPAQLGSYKVDSSVDVFATRKDGRNPVSVISDPDTAVVSYAVTATGQGTGFVTMVFGNGQAFTPEGDPVQVKVFKVANQLYTGDLKVLSSSNPLDEQVTLRHSADFAGKPEDYEFEWRWAPGEASAPATYATLMTTRIGDPAAVATRDWVVVRDPGAQLPNDDQYDAVPPAPYPPNPVTLPRTENVRPTSFILNAQGQPITLPATQIAVPAQAGPLTLGTIVTDGAGGVIRSTIVGIVDSTRYVVLPVIASGQTDLIFETAGGGQSDLFSCEVTQLTSNVNTLNSVTSYSDAEIAAGYPSLVAKSTVGVDFTGGVPGAIVFSADLGTYDGFVLYVNGRAAVAHKAPESLFTNSVASIDLTTSGLSKQFSVEPNYFTAGPNTIEVAIYTDADPNVQSTLDFRLEAALENDLVTSGNVWQTPSGQNAATNLLPYGSSVLVGGEPLPPFGGPQFVLNDRWFTMRYRPKKMLNGSPNPAWTLLNGTKLESDPTTYSRWMPPQFVEGWIKRVLAAINPFEQRVKDLYNNQVNTDVSVVTQAGKRWEGDIALTMDNINDAGLIEIYETVLNRAKSMSLDAAGYAETSDTSNALLLAAGYLNDLYTILGNEAYADAANPTISIDDPSAVFEVNTSRFSFEGQVATALDEELALLRGRNDFVSPGVRIAPAYNRMYWNYTRGINGGEVIYAVNYNIKEKVGSSTADGVIDESDAQRMFPQGHGDAYGHYLTALTGYYRLLTNAKFTWAPRAEAVTVLGQPVTVDFFDERKFAAAAGNVARTAQQICALTYRQNYVDDPAAGWGSYRDNSPPNTQTNITSAQGLDEWVSRSTQGAFLHWAVANALVPDVDTYHPANSVQKIDRTTVPEIAQLAAAGATFQTTIDNASARLNPLGLSPGSLAFDIDPTFLAIGSTAQVGTRPIQGQALFGQNYQRALVSLRNAVGAFNQAATMTRSLRDQTNQIDDYNTAIVEQERAYRNQLIDIYGRPYSGDIGAGKLYAQGYTGPDLTHWFIVDRPNDLVDPKGTISITIREVIGIRNFTGNVIADVGTNLIADPNVVLRTVTIQPSQYVQYNDVWQPGGLGSRAETGELQEALQDAQQTWLAIWEANQAYRSDVAQMNDSLKLFDDMVTSHKNQLNKIDSTNSAILALEGTVLGLRTTAAALNLTGDFSVEMADALAEFPPYVLGPAAADITSTVRGTIKSTGAALAAVARGLAVFAEAGAGGAEIGILNEQQQLDRTLADAGFTFEEKQAVYEFGILYRHVTTQAAQMMQLTLTHQRALQNVNNVLARGLRIQAEREVFRQRAAAIIQGYRTKDLTFRIFRNEALEQYRSLFDLASRYTYLAAKAFDYELGLLGTPAAQDAVFNKIVAARALGDITGGTPVATVSALGDAGLAGVIAKLDADFSVAEGRLGINNPDQYGTVFSLRHELYRLKTDVTGDQAWQQTLEQHKVANVMNDADVATYCRNIRKPDGSAVPGFVIPFSTTIEHGKNFFGLPLAGGDHNYSPSSYSTKIHSVGIAFDGYIGMDTYASGSETAGGPATGDANALSATPYVYFIPCGIDYMRAPPLGDTDIIRSWDVNDQALPLPYNLGANDFNSTQFFNANGTLSEKPWIIRKHQAFRAVGDPTLFYGSFPIEFTNTRLCCRSVWNSQWKLVIPAYSLLNNEADGMKRFAASVKDIKIFLRTYSNSGN